MPRGWRMTNVIWLVISISWCHISLGSGSNKVHHHMSVDELRRIFQVEHHNDVPDYEVVQIHSVRHKRSAAGGDVHRVNLATHGRQLRLELRPNLDLMKRDLDLWYADAFPTNVSYSPVEKDLEPLGEVYQDEGNQAALLLYRDKTDDALLMDGTIGDDLVVKPISAEVRAKVSSSRADDLGVLYEDVDFALEKRWTSENDDYAFLDENEAIADEDVMRSKRDVNSEFHVVYKRKDNFDQGSDYHFMEMDQFPMRKNDAAEEDEESERPGKSRKKRQAPYLIFPEILCIIDYDGYRLHGKDNVAIKRYVISFWNGIDLRYKLLKDPGVKISIAGIIISRGRDATPYLERNRVGRDAIDSASALTDMGKYLFLERRLPVYDIAVAITKLDMCRRTTRYGECNRGTAGFAYVGGACVVNKRLEKVNSVAIVEDTGGFSGIIVAAHELGHLLGAVHDGSPPPSYLGGPGAKKCRWEDGFIMSDLRHTSKGFRWSHCTIKQFHHFLNGETATCMYNSPHETESLARVLPGKLLTLDAQCRKDRGTSACFKDDRVCAQLFCFDAGSGYCVSYRPAAEGSRCGDGAICLNGKCVAEHENSVDYEGPGFLRRVGLADVDHINDDGADTPAEPSTNRKWWNLIPTSTEKPSWRDRLSSPSTTTATVSTTTSTTSTTTSTTSTTTSTTTTTTKITTTTTATTSTSRLPWWKRLQSRKRTESTTVVPPSTITTPLTTPSPSSRRSQIQTVVTKTVSKSSGTASVSEKQSQTDEPADSEDDNEDEEDCEDRINNIAGSLSCGKFLQSFAYQYCRHKYIKKNCCASHKVYCLRGRRGRMRQLPSKEVATMTKTF